MRRWTSVLDPVAIIYLCMMMAVAACLFDAGESNKCDQLPLGAAMPSEVSRPLVLPTLRGPSLRSASISRTVVQRCCPRSRSPDLLPDLSPKSSRRDVEALIAPKGTNNGRVIPW
ncbi:hypothetical protein GGR56DRAFT_558743 [Xylariaceae sp. FL0804]|nr:hypothetical protein GGR56DRAFT_558743 [Xylariaceae sp. FL0804]